MKCSFEFPGSTKNCTWGCSLPSGHIGYHQGWEAGKIGGRYVLVFDDHGFARGFIQRGAIISLLWWQSNLKGGVNFTLTDDIVASVNALSHLKMTPCDPAREAETVAMVKFLMSQQEEEEP